MPHFLKKITLFFVCTFLLYFFIGIVLERIIRENVQNNQFQFQEDWHLKHPKYNEVLFIGNSRTWAQVDVKLIAKKKAWRSFCLAQDGRDSRILFFKLKKYLELNKAPKHIFLQFDPSFLCECNDGTFYGKKNYLGYMYHDWLKINSIFNHEIGFDNFDVYFPLKRYFSTIGGLPILYYHLSAIKPKDYQNFKYGSFPQHKDWTPSSKWSQPNFTDCPLDFKYINSILFLCQSNHIALTFFYPPQSFPSYHKVNNKLIISLAAFARKHRIKYWNFNHKKYNQIDFFYNHMHLNAQGSLIFTHDLLDSISQNEMK